MDLCDTYRRLADDIDPYVRAEVAKNENIPNTCACDIFNKLVRGKTEDGSFYSHDGKMVRARLARNDSIPPEDCACHIYESLISDKDEDINYKLANNNAILGGKLPCACDIYRKLTDLKNIGSEDEATLVDKRLIREPIAKWGKIPEECRCEIYKGLAQADWSVRSPISLRHDIPSTCKKEVEQIIKDKDAKMRERQQQYLKAQQAGDWKTQQKLKHTRI